MCRFTLRSFLFSFFFTVLLCTSAGVRAAQDPPTVTPPAGYSGFPTIDAADGRFVAVAQGLSTLGVGDSNFTICVDPQGGLITNLDVWIFDGDTNNPASATATIASFWDIEFMGGNDPFGYHLYADPDLTGDQTTEFDINGGLAGKAIDAVTLPDNDWDQLINRPLDPEALNASGLYCYNLEARYEAPLSGNNQSNRLKLASDTSGNGRLRLLRGTSAGFVGLTDIAPVSCANPGSLPCVFPGRDTTYDGVFPFNVVVTAAGGVPCAVSIWEGDSDHAVDTDHPNTPDFPPFFTPIPPTQAEGAHPGIPADNGGGGSATIGGNVFLDITGPGNNYFSSFPNPSGDREWERRKIVSNDVACPAPPADADVTASSLVGTHLVQWKDLDGDNQIFLLVEAGEIAAECSLDVEKTCQLPPSGNNCQGKVVSMVFEYVGGPCTVTNSQSGKASCTGTDLGSQQVSIVVNVDAATVSASPKTGIKVGDLVSFTTTNAQFGNDFDVNVNGTSASQRIKAHTSCSKPLNVGDRFGSLKLVELTTTEGGTVSLPQPGEACEYTPPDGPHCEKDLTALVFFYRGGDCTVTTNNQDGSLKCSGSDPGAGPVSVTVTKNPGTSSAVPKVNIFPGDFIVFTDSSGKLKNPIGFDLTGPGGTQSLEIKTDCSKALNLGDRFGALEVATIANNKGKVFSLSTLVEYVYTVTNNNVAAVTNISLDDDVVGNIVSGLNLNAGESQQFSVFQILDETTTNNVTATGDFGAGECSGSDSVTVILNPPPPPPFECDDIDALTMIWDGGPGSIRIKAWKGAVGSTLLADIDGIFAGDEVTVSGYAGSPNDVVWEIFAGGTSTKLAESRFHLSCSDDDMDGPEDCGKHEGNAKTTSNFTTHVNLWILEGMADAGSGTFFDCTP